MNLFQIPEILPDNEIFETLIPDKGILVERIISSGQASEEEFWYEQERDELVFLLQGQAKLAWEDGRILEMHTGDWVLIPAMERHRVEWTSSAPPCIWLAIHAKLQ